MPPLLVQALALLSVPLAGLSGVLGLRLRRAAGIRADRESRLRQRVAELEEQCAELARTAARDPLTGVWNYRHLQLTLEREIERCNRRPGGRPQVSGQQRTEEDGSRSVAVVLLEIDGFEAINAEHGRSRGNVILRDLAQRLSVEIRRSDTLGRYDGTEFLVVLPDTGADGAAKVAERLCWSVRRHRLLDFSSEPWVEHGPARPGNGLTATAGIAVLPQDGTHAVPLLRAADRALAVARERRAQPAARGPSRGVDRQEPAGAHDKVASCAGLGPAALAGSVRTVAGVAVADESPSQVTDLVLSQGGHPPQ